VEIVPMTAEYAADIITWRYAPPYDCYDMTEADPAFITSEAGGYFALADGGALIGFRSFGADGQVPGGRYDGQGVPRHGGTFQCPRAARRGEPRLPARGQLHGDERRARLPDSPAYQRSPPVST
jgi:hypothetical protein